ncbi:DUF3071 domain-containing protein [Auraticoccus sp. F435]|uniref:DUF3071 domain-containing protein n=1 Tax=Auraticoccus cholistanensis TaxID=2656650 RepID=A0A6A9UVM2_9ACTN|nr:septation protein SepH [Auraticoccus cholistanensis]MVA75725.1 DUF3071 domain-containing protein [Auraticoccus cholistanensis]
MRTARPTGLSPDGSALIVVTDSGEEVAVANDERLAAALRRDRPGLAQVEMQMESELRPREIQDRIRGGASPEQVAEEAGVPLERIQAFAAPVLAERNHITSLALASPVRRRGEAQAGRTLRDVVGEQLGAVGQRADALVWDAWRTEDRQWWLRATLPGGDGSPERRATFRFDQRARSSAAEDDDARWMLGELSQPSRPGARTGDPDSEPTEDLEDELALVRALSQGRPLADPGFLTEPEDDREDSGPVWRPGAPRHDSGRLPRLDPAHRPVPAPAPRSSTPPSPPRPAVEEPAGAPLDDPYDIIPSDQSDLDVLYEMLGGLQEDSVNIYAGLSDPVPGPDSAEEAPTSRAERRRRRRRRDKDADEQPQTPSGDAGTGEAGAAEGGVTAAPADPAQQPPVQPDADQPEPEPVDPVREEPAPVAAAGDETADEPEPQTASGDLEQPSLLDDSDTPATEQPAPARRSGRRKRASVPSWDEIMFGAPRS